MWVVSVDGLPVPIGMFDEPPPEGQAYIDGALVPEFMENGWWALGDSQRALDLMRDFDRWVKQLW